MIGDHIARFAGVRRRALLVIVALAAPLTCLGLTSSASAEKVPTGEWAVFKQCPRSSVTETDDYCLFSEITEGELTLNKLTVPITRPFVFQGLFEGEPKTLKFLGAVNGETIGPVPQPIPGGLSALIDCGEIQGFRYQDRARRRACEEAFENRWTPRSWRQAYETMELARPATEIGINSENAIFEKGTALTLPVRVHLENPLLGKDCYIGSTADPIMLALTTGTTEPSLPNHPISGHAGETVYSEEFTLITTTDHISVGNDFSVPAATGCGGYAASFVDPLINGKIGLPAPAGYNAVVHGGFVKEGFVPAVVASEEEVKTGKKVVKVGKGWMELWNRWISHHGRH